MTAVRDGDGGADGDVVWGGGGDGGKEGGKRGKVREGIDPPLLFTIKVLTTPSLSRLLSS